MSPLSNLPSALLLGLSIASTLRVLFTPSLSLGSCVLCKWIQGFATTSTTTTSTLHDASSLFAPDHGIKRIGSGSHQAIGVASVRRPGSTADAWYGVVLPDCNSSQPSWAIIVPLSMQYIRGGA